MTAAPRPLLAIVYGPGASSAFLISDGATATCDIVWVVDSNELEAWSLRLLRKIGRMVDIAGMAEEEAADALRAVGPDGIVAYADAQIAVAAALGERLGLDYHDRVVAERLLDKVRQRQALSDGSLPVPTYVAVPARPTPDTVDGLLAAIEFPVVIKPRHGAASRDTHMAHDPETLRALIAEHSTDDDHSTMVVESYMVGASSPPSELFSDYVSVETVVTAGDINHLAVTGRLPQDEPFRETGLIIPSDFDPDLQAEILAVATAAIRVIGIRVGCLHTEIKVTTEGPRVIEVNGRIGGFVPQTLKLASPETDLFELSRRAALGEKLVFAGLVPTSGVGYVIAQQPPIGARRVASVEGLDRLADYPGVDAVALSRQPGDEVDWRKGSHEYVFSVLGNVPQHEEMAKLQRFIANEVTVTYEWEQG